jgi:hypothetical protein
MPNMPNMPNMSNMPDMSNMSNMSNMRFPPMPQRMRKKHTEKRERERLKEKTNNKIHDTSFFPRFYLLSNSSFSLDNFSPQIPHVPAVPSTVVASTSTPSPSSGAATSSAGPSSGAATSSMGPNNQLMATVYVGKIPVGVEDGYIKMLLDQCGLVSNWRRVADPVTGKMKGAFDCFDRSLEFRPSPPSLFLLRFLL